MARRIARAFDPLLAGLRLRGRLLLVLVLVGILPLLGLIVYTAAEQRRQLASTGVQDALGLARLINKHQENLIEGVRDTLVAVVHLPEVRGGDAAACSRLLSGLLPQYPRYANMGVAGPEGAIACSALPLGGAVDVADRPWFSRALQTREMAVGEYQVGRITGRATLNVGYPILSDDRSQAHGVAFAALDLAWVSQIGEQAPLPAGATFTVVDRAGTILARYPDPERWIGRPLPEAALLNAVEELRDCGATPSDPGERQLRRVASVAPCLDEGTLETRGADGVARLYAFSPLGGLPDAGVYSIVGVPRAAALAAANQLLVRNLAGLVLVGLVVLGAVWMGGDLFIARPVNVLLRATQRLAGGDLRARTGLRYDRGELGQLARAFDQMAGALEQRTAERRQMGEQLLSAQRLEAAGLIASQVAHDFNNLLGPLVALPELLKAQLPPDDEVAAGMCDTMLMAAQQMRDICEDLRMLGGGHSNRVPLDVNDVVEQALARMAPPPHTLDLEVDLDDDALPVSGSEAQLGRVVTNLINNAREAMHDAGRLTVRTDRVYLDRPLGRQSQVGPGEYARVVVSDTGPGIPPEIRDRIFEPFYTTKRTAEQRGSGLGLSIVLAKIDEHGGGVDLETEVGKGTTFSIYLPLSHEVVAERRIEEVRGGRERILVVDDDPLQRETIGQMLRRLGYQVDAVAGGEAAVGCVCERPVDLLILDMVMPPGIDGCETYRRILHVRPAQRAIIVSGYAESERVKEAQALGAGAYIRKPLSLARLAQAVREELDRRADGRAAVALPAAVDQTLTGG